MKKHNNKVESYLIPAGLLIGIGIGMATNQVAAGTLIGLGCGFLGMFIVNLKKKY